MPLNEPTDRPLSEKLHFFGEIVRLAAMVLGLVAIGLGISYAADLFWDVRTAIKHPQEYHATLDGWAQALGGEDQKVVWSSGQYRADRLLAITVLGGGTFMLVWIIVAIITAGAKVIAWSVPSAETVKRVLKETLGPNAAEKLREMGKQRDR